MAQTDIPIEVQCAFGRIFRMGARPTQDGDLEMYEKCRAIIMDYAEEIGIIPSSGYRPNYARDHARYADRPNWD